MHIVSKIKREHVLIKKKLDELQNIIGKASREIIRKNLFDFETFWAQHEEKEEKFFNSFGAQEEMFPTVKMILSQHRELRGHWKVIRVALEKGSDFEIEVALGTDGRMLFEKFRKHIEEEDKYLRKNFRKL